MLAPASATTPLAKLPLVDTVRPLEAEIEDLASVANRPKALSPPVETEPPDSVMPAAPPASTPCAPAPLVAIVVSFSPMAAPLRAKAPSATLPEASTPPVVVTIAPFVQMHVPAPSALRPQDPAPDVENFPPSILKSPPRSAWTAAASAPDVETVAFAACIEAPDPEA